MISNFSLGELDKFDFFPLTLAFDADYQFIIPSSRYMNNYEQIANHAPFGTIPG
jgi:hypothetical protein